MQRATLVLNAAILVVTFVVALTAGDVQGELLTGAIRTAEAGSRGPRVDDGAALALLRVIQSLENFYPATPENKLTRTQIEAIEDAVELYRSEIRSEFAEVVVRAEDDQDLRGQLTQLGKSLRIDLESILGKEFSDAGVVQRLTTEVIRTAR